MNDKRISKDSYADSPYEIVMVIYSETLVAVKADLAEKPAERGENVAPVKGRGIKAFFWKLYETTVKAFFDSLLGKSLSK